MRRDSFAAVARRARMGPGRPRTPPVPGNHPEGELDGRYLSSEVAGGFTGRVIGAYAAEGTVHVDWFDYAPLD